MGNINNRTITDVMRQEMAEMARQNVHMASIAEEMTVSVASVYRILAEMGVTLPRSRAKAKITPEQQVQLIEAYVAGDPMPELLTQYGLTYQILYRFLDEARIPRRAAKKTDKAKSDVRVDYAVELYQQDELTLAEITVETGVHQPRIHQELRNRGLPLRQARRRKERQKMYSRLTGANTPGGDPPVLEEGPLPADIDTAQLE